MPADMNELADDVAAETAVLRELVAGLDEPGWRRPTPAPGWSIADQVSHLAHFDEAATASAVRPREFDAELARARRAGERLGDRHPFGGDRAGDLQRGVIEMAALGHHQAEVQRATCHPVRGLGRPPQPHVPAG